MNEQEKSAAPIAQEPPEPGVCAMCGHAFSMPDGLEPTEVCNTCAQEFYATHAAPQVAQEPVAPEHVAWCRYIRSSSDRPTRIALCDSDADGAFKVYRAAPIAAPAGSTVVDLADDDALRFACRVLDHGSFPPEEDRASARAGLMAIRTRLRASPPPNTTMEE